MAFVNNRLPGKCLFLCILLYDVDSYNGYRTMRDKMAIKFNVFSKKYPAPFALLPQLSNKELIIIFSELATDILKIIIIIIIMSTEQVNNL